MGSIEIKALIRDAATHGGLTGTLIYWKRIGQPRRR